VIVAAIIFALIPLLGLQLFLVVPLIGLVLALGAPPDYVSNAKAVTKRRRNLVLGVAVLVCIAVLILQPQLTLVMLRLFGLDVAGLVIALIAVTALALPLAMADSALPITELPSSRVVVTRRNLLLCLTAAVTVAVWYTGPGLSYLPIAALVIGLPVPIVLSRLLAWRRSRLEFNLLRHPFHRSLLPQQLQFLNVLLLCGLLVATLFTGAYAAVAFDFTPGAEQAFQIGFVCGALILLLTAAVPLKHVRVASNLLVLAGSVFVGVQLGMIYRTPVDPVPIASPLADEWLVGQGGHSELVNYHYVTSTQRDALDILQARNGLTHQPGSTDLTSYYIYRKPVLAPAAGTVTFVLDGRPDQAIGSADDHYQSGNNVVIDTGGGRYVLMAHLSPGSIQVKAGDHVELGQQIAKVGNSGNTTEPHLHLQAQTIGTGIGDIATIDIPATIRTLHTRPLVFTDVVLIRGNEQLSSGNADPRRGDLVRPNAP
jgi:hypothetical protein